jgi:glycosyltransferase involved in cell wall biosynthesis
MLIGIDASRATVDRRTGVEGYSINVIQHLLTLPSEHRFRLYFRDAPPNDLFSTGDHVEWQVIRRPRLWTHTGLGWAVRRDKPDALFVPSHVLPWPGLGGVPSVVTVHDLGYRHYPDKHPLFDRLYLSWSTGHSARLARRVIAVSEATAHDLVALNGVPKEKVTVVHSGVDSLLHPVKDDRRIAEVKKKLGIRGAYLLHVGSLRPRKNLQTLIDAFSIVKQDNPDLQLVLAGSQSWGYQRLIRHIHKTGMSEDVVLPGYVDDNDLPALYSGAIVYVFPSLYEGFGFPALEAMACGTPVACSNSSSLPELVGDAALTFAPSDVTGMAKAIQKLVQDKALRRGLVQKGFSRVENFTWRTCAQQTLAVIEEAASGV